MFLSLNLTGSTVEFQQFSLKTFDSTVRFSKHCSLNAIQWIVFSQCWRSYQLLAGLDDANGFLVDSVAQAHNQPTAGATDLAITHLRKIPLSKRKTMA